MEQIFHEIKIDTNGQGFYDFTNKTISWLEKQKIENGMLNINILHSVLTVYSLYYFNNVIFCLV